MRIALTGGAGDLGRTVAPRIRATGGHPVVLDVRKPNDDTEFINVSITDRDLLRSALKGFDAVVHIAAWHGIHEFRKERDVYDFWDLNVSGTFNVFQTSVENGIDKFVFISSTSIDDRFGVYGHTKVLSEEIARTYASRHQSKFVTLRPRAFIPPWNRSVYNSFIEWAKWFWPGAVHIDDVADAVMKSLTLLQTEMPLPEPLFLTVDGAYDYGIDEIHKWDLEGAGSTFRKHYGQYYDLVVSHGLDPAVKPKILDIGETRKWLGYEPKYSLRNLLIELQQYGEAGPPPPF
ncbi:MAG: NAD(P)-dependent oxidoreductase [Candidatus Obscuribacterales bacterium]|nr:NAD(P)-dependent oxidoreductase [Candidatus Obscuribacterales bacterium]